MTDVRDEQAPSDAALSGAPVADAPDVLDAEPVELDDEGAAGEDDSDAKRPSVHGRKAKPRKKKSKGADEGAAERKKRKRPSARTVRRVIAGVIIVLLAALLVGAGLFCWQKWLRYDDAADIQGVWKVEATGDTIVFDGRNLKLTRGISYAYRLDADEKAIVYTFGDLEGGGHYYFSADRQQLVIVDGDERLGVLAEVGFLPDDLLENDVADDNKTVLSKVSGDTSAEPSGTATGVSAGGVSGEREYVVKPEPSTSSSSSKSSRTGSKRSSRSADDEDAENRGFVDEDGDGYDDETGLEYDDFMLERGNYAFTDEDEDGFDDRTGLEYEDFQAVYGGESEAGEPDDEDYDGDLGDSGDEGDDAARDDDDEYE